MATRNPEIERMKAEFIAKQGIKKLPSSKELYEKQAERFLLKEKSPVIKKERPMPLPPSEIDMGAKPALMWIPVKSLHINDVYQRSISTGRGQSVIREIVASFRWPLFGVLMVTQRKEGGYWVIDGQHRMNAAKHAGIDKVPCMLIVGLDTRDQAKIFTGINARRVNMSVQALHHAKVAAGEEDAVALQEACIEADVVILPYPKAAGQGLKPNETLMVTNLRCALKKLGREGFVEVLKGISRDYPNTVGKLCRDVLRDRITKYEIKKLYGDE